MLLDSSAIIHAQKPVFKEIDTSGGLLDAAEYEENNLLNSGPLARSKVKCMCFITSKSSLTSAHKDEVALGSHTTVPTRTESGQSEKTLSKLGISILKWNSTGKLMAIKHGMFIIGTDNFFL